MRVKRKCTEPFSFDFWLVDAKTSNPGSVGLSIDGRYQWRIQDFPKGRGRQGPITTANI